MQFYQSVLGGELHISRFSDFPEAAAAVPEDYKNKAMHASLDNGMLSFMASDGKPGSKVMFGDSVHMSIAGKDTEKLTAYFNGLAAGGTITMPLDMQMWGDTFGMLTDKFGIHWMVNIAGEHPEQ